jgi:hypothetical protein
MSGVFEPVDAALPPMQREVETQLDASSRLHLGRLLEQAIGNAKLKEIWVVRLV